MLAVLERRLDQALGGSVRRPGDRAAVTVLLVGRGSADPDANAEVYRAARLLWEGRGYAGVETAFASLAAPDVPSGLDRCVRLGARRIVVLPYVLFAGVLPDRVRLQTEGWAAAHPEGEVVSADVIGPEPVLLDLVMERYREAVEGSPEAGDTVTVTDTTTTDTTRAITPMHSDSDRTRTARAGTLGRAICGTAATPRYATTARRSSTSR